MGEEVKPNEKENKEEEEQFFVRKFEDFFYRKRERVSVDYSVPDAKLIWTYGCGLFLIGVGAGFIASRKYASPNDRIKRDAVMQGGKAFVYATMITGGLSALGVFGVGRYMGVSSMKEFAEKTQTFNSEDEKKT